MRKIIDGKKTDELLPPRRERRAKARKLDVPFKPYYAEGLEPKTHLEMYGVGYERFDTAYMTVSDKLVNGGIQ